VRSYPAVGRQRDDVRVEVTLADFQLPHGP
jgi:hypothetical protein